MALPRGAPLTYADLQDVPDDGHRYELVDGTLLVTPSPTGRHQLCVSNLLVLLHDAIDRDLVVLPAPYDYVVSDVTVLEPDVLVLRAADLGDVLRATPLLAVEVLSPSTRRVDLTLKRSAYEAAGVPEYWAVDPGAPSLLVLRPDAATGRYTEEAHVTGDEAYVSTAFAVTVVPRTLVQLGG